MPLAWPRHQHNAWRVFMQGPVPATYYSHTLDLSFLINTSGWPLARGVAHRHEPHVTSADLHSYKS